MPRTFPSEFLRVAWTSDTARAVWEPRLRRITLAWTEIEWRSVASGVRDCAILLIPPADLPARAIEWLQTDLSYLPLELYPTSGDGYLAAAPVAPIEGGRFNYWMAVGRVPALRSFEASYRGNDHHGVSAALGYPRCCYERFHDVWVEQGLMDTTWSMAQGSGSLDGDGSRHRVQGNDMANILWRWLGIRAVPHLPCSFACSETAVLGERMLAVGEDSGFSEEMAWLREILAWPIEWSSLHEIAEIRTPILRITTTTDPCNSKRVVRRDGNRYPDEGARGITFPYSMARSRSETASGTLANRDALENGFSSAGAMRKAHRPIVETVGRFAPKEGVILDLGCGSGALLELIRQRYPGLVPHGIDVMAERVDVARSRLSLQGGVFHVGNMFECDGLWSYERTYALTLLMPGRLLEVPPEQAAVFLDRLFAKSDRVIAYAYGDWLHQPGGLSALAAIAGLQITGTFENSAAGLVVRRTDGGSARASSLRHEATGGEMGKVPEVIDS